MYERCNYVIQLYRRSILKPCEVFNTCRERYKTFIKQKYSNRFEIHIITSTLQRFIDAKGQDFRINIYRT